MEHPIVASFCGIVANEEINMHDAEVWQPATTEENDETRDFYLVLSRGRAASKLCIHREALVPRGRRKYFFLVTKATSEVRLSGFLVATPVYNTLKSAGAGAPFPEDDRHYFVEGKPLWRGRRNVYDKQ